MGKKDNVKISKIRINMIDDLGLINEFEIEYPCSSFKYKNKKYKIISKYIYLKFEEKEYFPCLYYNEKFNKPMDFSDKNKGIPSRALNLMWNPTLYRILFTPDNDKTNKIIIIVMIASIIMYAVTLYLKFR